MKCRTQYCRGQTHKRYHSPWCPKCSSRRFKDAHPLKYSFNKLKQRAKERGHEFDLTFEQYEQFAVATGYDKLKGKTKHSLSIDREDATKGYTSKNIRSVSLSLNVRLHHSKMPQWLKDEMLAAERGEIRHKPEDIGEAA